MYYLFIKELKLPEPNAFLNVKSGSQGMQTARLIVRSEKILKKEKPDIVLVEGDTNSALGAALAASKLKIPVGHVEAGCRSFDKNMPEEINRVLISDLASLHFAPTRTCVQNLLKEGISKKQIYLTGHPIIDLLHDVQNKINKERIAKFGLTAKKYYLLTLHREENVDYKDKLESILMPISILAQTRRIIFPIHPHTHKSIRKFGLSKYLRNLIVIESVGYLDALSLIKYTRIVLTDSGGIQQEAALLGTPCVTLRANTEWIETVNLGVNFLAKSDKEIITTIEKVERQYQGYLDKAKLVKGIYGEPGVSAKIVNIVEERVLSN